ncbi:MAG: glycosyltransferase family 39 protein, partial [Planctomycetes bacterium]|nr:glycosyltransferase family 39 protein [Planctomycetota bacterium]
MYVAAGRLLREHSLYADFAYLQAPYLPFLYALVFSLADGSHLLLCGRAASLVMGLVAFCIVCRTCHELSGSQRMGALCTVLFAGHHLTLFVLPYARNHVVALSLSLAAFYLFVRAVRSPGRGAAWSALAGLLSGLAIGTKLITAPLAVALLLASLITPRRRRLRDRLIVRLLPFLLGLAFSLAPAVWVFATTDPEVAWFNNVGYHDVNLLWRSVADSARAMTLTGKLVFAAEYLVKGSGVALLIAFGLVLWRRRYATSRSAAGRMASPADAITVATLSLAAAVLAAFVPTPMQRDYLAMIVPFVVLLLAGLMGRWAVSSDRVLRQAIAGLAALTFLVGLATSLRHLRHLPHLDRWTPIVTRHAGQHLARVMSRAGAPGKVATLAPIFPLEGGLQIYRELATGPFFYRVGDLI